MKVLVIPDIHLKSWIFDRADVIMKTGKADRAVCLMDIPDDWDMEFQVERYKEAFDRAITFAKEYPDTLWCYGNHDVSYPWGKLETGYSPYAEKTVIEKLEELENSLHNPSQINIVHRIDNILFMHGGLTEIFVKKLEKGLLDAKIDDVIAAVNAASIDILWNDESPLWFRPQYKAKKMFRADTYKQVVGHTPVDKIFEKDSIISTDVFSTYRDGRQIGESAMIVIDSINGDYEKINVMGKLDYSVETESLYE
ncbi:MAG: metallophosphoesterase [Lachnospiraceae bacterium]|nr:metallophosphoesterase [Lachnospiraceae bacterium]